MKFVIVINGRISIGKALNTTSHLLTALVHNMSDEDRESISVIDYKDADGNSHPASSWPQIILKAKNSNQIRKIRNAAKSKGLHYVDFTSTMTIANDEEQLKITSETKEENLEYYGTAIFGPKETVSEITNKYSLYT